MGKYVNQKKQNKDDWFNSVVKNAILFLKSSIEHLDSSPRNSVIDLYTAIELLFKARLMKEHWSLIITRPEDANLTAFESGDFHSVYLEQSEKRLKNICGEKFKKEAMENFKAIGEHRNQIVHFAHTGFSGQKNSVILEHWASWYYLYDLINSQWSDTFTGYHKHFELLNKRIYKNSEFLKVKYKAIEKEIDIERKKGNEVVNCPSCKLDGALIKKTNYWGKDFECLVCDVKDEIPVEIKAMIPCGNCTKPLAYFLLDDDKCPHCQHEISSKHALDEYIKLYHSDFYEDANEDEYEDVNDCYPVGYCHSCEADVASVVEIGGVEVCVLCEERGWRIMKCDRCGEYVTGDRDKIVYFACHLCEDDARREFEEDMAAFEAEME
ncbi:TPA: hypothetical protein ACX6NR_000002 [Photobacterium damselae]|uniref:hypothetical protein n=1 Tax=Photobacterium damselae TaxID=38293 RepID=UPI003D7E1873